MEQLQVLFGSKTTANILLYITASGSGYATRIAKTFDLPLSAVQRQLIKLESGGILVSRLMGKTRVFEFNPRSGTAKNLQSFLLLELDSFPRDEAFKRYFCQRQRPRRTGKKLT